MELLLGSAILEGVLGFLGFFFILSFKIQAGNGLSYSGLLLDRNGAHTKIRTLRCSHWQ